MSSVTIQVPSPRTDNPLRLSGLGSMTTDYGQPQGIVRTRGEEWPSLEIVATRRGATNNN